MRKTIIALFQFILFLSLAAHAAPGGNTHEMSIAKVSPRPSIPALPLYFVENHGQTAGEVRFYEQGQGHTTFFTPGGLVFSLAGGHGPQVVRISFEGGRKSPDLVAEGPLETKVNYFKGRDASRWYSDIPVYRALWYRDVYRGVDIKYYGSGQRVEHDIVVRKGADPAAIRFVVEGIRSARVTPEGDLELALGDGIITERRPFIYQEKDGKRREVKGGYRLLGKVVDGRAVYGFTLASYDKDKDLVIDPVIDYSTYFGGSGDDFARDIAVDSTGATYITGWTLSVDFPLASPLQGVNKGGILTGDAFVTKINPAGTAVVYSTYIGGSGDEDSITIAVDSSGAAYITGDTQSLNFPTTNSFQPIYGGGLKDAFVAKLSPTGNSLVYSSFLGGTGEDNGKGLAIDSTGAIYLTGWTASLNFPVVGPVQAAMAGIQDAYVTKINPAGTAIVYSTYLGGTDVDSGRAITVNSAGEAYVTGHTWSFNFPLKFPVQGTFGGIKDVVVFKLNAAGNGLVFSTYLGGSSAEKSKGIALNSNGAIYITGWTTSSDFPVVAPLQGALNGIQDAFVTKFAPPGRRILYSTYLGGSDSDSGRDIAVDGADNIYVAGHTWSPDFPLVNPAQAVFGGLRDAFVTKINLTGTAVLYSTYLGGAGDDTARGVVVDSAGVVYLTGGTDSLNFPIVSPLQGINAGLNDAFIVRLVDGGGPVVTLSLMPDTSSVALGGTLGYTATVLNNTSISQCVAYWENLTLPGGLPYPTTGELFGPLTICVNANAAKTAHLTKSIPVTAPLGTYVLNAFVGSPYPSVIDLSSFNFNVTAFGPVTGKGKGKGRRTWGLLENGFIR